MALAAPAIDVKSLHAKIIPGPRPSILLCGIDWLYVARREHTKIITAPVSATIGDRELGSAPA
jgi:hypothetical protein